MCFTAVATPLPESIHTPDSARPFVFPFADRCTLPSPFPFCLTLTTFSQRSNGPCQKETALTPFESMCPLDQERFPVFSLFHPSAFLASSVPSLGKRDVGNIYISQVPYKNVPAAKWFRRC